MRPHFEVWQNFWTRQWRWRLIAENGRKIATAGESFHNRNDCLASIRLVREVSEAPVVKAAKPPKDKGL